MQTFPAWIFRATFCPFMRKGFWSFGIPALDGRTLAVLRACLTSSRRMSFSRLGSPRCRPSHPVSKRCYQERGGLGVDVRADQLANRTATRIGRSARSEYYMEAESSGR